MTDDVLSRLRSALEDVPPAHEDRRSQARSRLDEALRGGRDGTGAAGGGTEGRSTGGGHGELTPLYVDAQAPTGRGAPARSYPARALVRIAAVVIALAAVGAVIWSRGGTPPRARALGGQLPAGGLPGVARQVTLGGVSCPSATECVAIGRDDTSTATLAMVQIWNGSTWSVERSTPDEATVLLSGVSCASTRLCIAVGWDHGASDTGGPAYQTGLAEMWDGTRWTLTQLPRPSGAGNMMITAVSCPSASFCVAIGTSDNRAPLSEVWNGTRWTVVSRPLPPGMTSSGYVNDAGVSCSSSQFCMAVGTYGASSDAAAAGFAQVWNGTSWALQSPPDPTSGSPFGVSCTSARFCMVTGSSGQSGDGVLAEEWDGSHWVVLSTPNYRFRGSEGKGVLGSVSCTSPAACAALGTYSVNVPGRQVTAVVVLAEVWDGARWRVTPAAQPTSYVAAIAGLSCVSPSSCTAVGSWTDGGGTSLTFAEGWDGTGWKVEPTPYDFDSNGGGPGDPPPVVGYDPANPPLTPPEAIPPPPPEAGG